MSDELARLDATAQAELVRGGEASPLELVDAAIERIEALNGELNAVIHPLFEEAARGGRRRASRRSLHAACRSCSRTWARRSPASRSTWACASSRRRISERPSTPTWRSASAPPASSRSARPTPPSSGILPTTEPDAYGRDAATPGTWRARPAARAAAPAAAVASGMVAVAHANDGGGSIRIPASACGLVGLKPTRQRTSAGPLTRRQHVRPDARSSSSRSSVRDTAAVLDAVHGPAPGRSLRGAAAAASLHRRGGRRARQAAHRAGRPQPLLDVDAGPRGACEAARDAGVLLESLGHAVEEGGAEAAWRAIGRRSTPS